MGALRELYWLMRTQIGVDPVLTLRSISGLPRFARDYRRFRSGYRGPMRMKPCLNDWHEEGGATKSEYFWQDLLVARMIHTVGPHRHVDVGSRIDGFVANVASFRDIEVFDVRPVSTKIPGVTFRQADLMFPPSDDLRSHCDSLSCLHALEHFGLGRYGDPIDPDGYALGFSNMAAMLAAGGIFYLSVPIGRERVEFNANRVFDPRVIIRLGAAHGLAPISLTIVKSGGLVADEAITEDKLTELAGHDYNLGIFVFRKITTVEGART